MLSLRGHKPVDIVHLAFYVWAIIQVADAFDQCDVRGRLTVTGRKSYLKTLFLIEHIKGVSGRFIETNILS